MTCTVDGCARPAHCRGLCRRDYARQWRANPPSLRPKVCRHCGAPYTGRRWTYCSAECHRAGHLAAPRNRRTRELVCPTCGHPFAGQPGQRYCGLACRPHRSA
jgi:hypothetical protein